MTEDIPSGPEYIRAFIAVSAGDEVMAKIGRLQAQFSRIDASVKWVDPAIMHLTLAFLGDVPADKVGPLSSLLDGVAAADDPFSYEVTGLGFFGSRRSPRVIWAGIHPDPAMFRIQEKLSNMLRVLGIALENRPFKPHLTIGRVRSNRNADTLVQKILSLADTNLGSVRTEAILLIKSVLRPQGPEYTVLHRSQLRTDLRHT